ncbi:MAG TPA: hypothetical protein PK228_13520 [Saprospiraceae bacterium]|nr:hypothetical protein [Saprospiraceae bacterium]
MRKHLFFFALLLPLSFAFTTPENDLSETGCPPPSNVTLTNQSGGAATFDWDGCGCIGAYLVYFTKDGQTAPNM